MKNFLFFILPFWVLSLMVCGCSKDDNESRLSFDKSKVIGSWSITSIEGNSDWYWISEGNTLTFKSDGTCSTGFTMEDTWKIENGRVCTYYKKSGEPILTYTLLSADGSIYKIKVQGTLDESNQSVIIRVNKK